MIDENECLNENEEMETIEALDLRAIHYNNIVDRYFTKYYIDQNTDKEQYIFIHTNGIIMCGLGKNHKLVKNNLIIKDIKDLHKVAKISGKRKHGAHILNENEYILEISTEQIKEHQDLNLSQEKSVIHFCPKVKGKLIEINSNIFRDFNLVKNSPEKNGFLCFVMQDPKGVQSLKEKLDKMNNAIII